MTISATTIFATLNAIPPGCFSPGNRGNKAKKKAGVELIVQWQRTQGNTDPRAFVTTKLSITDHAVTDPMKDMAEIGCEKTVS